MIVEYTRYKIEEGRRKSFEENYQKAANALRASSHCLAYELSHCTEDLNYYTSGSNGIQKRDIQRAFGPAPNSRPSSRWCSPT